MSKIERFDVRASPVAMSERETTASSAQHDYLRTGRGVIGGIGFLIGAVLLATTLVGRTTTEGQAIAPEEALVLTVASLLFFVGLAGFWISYLETLGRMARSRRAEFQAYDSPE